MTFRDPRIDQDHKVMVVIGERFASARKKDGASERDMADELGTTEEYIREFERGEGYASWATTVRWARILSITTEGLEIIEQRARREDEALKVVAA